MNEDLELLVSGRKVPDRGFCLMCIRNKKLKVSVNIENIDSAQDLIRGIRTIVDLLQIR